MWAFVVIAAIMQVITVVVGAQDDPNKLAFGLLQAIAFGLGICASWLFGRGSVKKAAEDRIAPHARTAMRRAIALYRSLDEQERDLGRAASRLKGATRTDDNNTEVVEYLLAEGIVANSMSLTAAFTKQAEAAIMDWVDVAPDAAQQLAAETANAWRAEGFESAN